MTLFAADIDSLVEACRKASEFHLDNKDADRDEWLTYASTIVRQPQQTSSCTPLQPFATRTRWLRCTRVPAPDEDAPDSMEILVSALASLKATSTFVVAKPGDQPATLTLGLETHEAGEAWLRSLLAPLMLFDSVRASPVAVGSFEHQAGVLLRLMAPADRERTGSDASITGLVSTLARLLAVPISQWCAVIRCDPVALRDVTKYLESLDLCNDLLAGQVSTSKQYGSFTSTRENGRVQHLQRWVAALTEQALDAAAIGGWQTTMHVLADDLDSLELVQAAMASGPGRGDPNASRWLGYQPRAVVGDPSPPTTFLSTADLVNLVRPPRSSTPGLQVVPPPPTGRRHAPTDRPIRLGYWLGVDDVLEIDVGDLSGHAFVCGVTGSGKSTTIRQVLADAWNRHGVPFLVIDPVKADYEDMRTMLTGELLVVDANDLRLNILAPHGNTDVRLHLELVANAFKGSFSFPSPTPYLISQLFDLIAVRAESAPFPTLHELHDLVDGFVKALGYSAEIESNIRAAISTRLKTLLSPAKAERVAARSSFGLGKLFSQPAVVQLAGMGDDAERAFVMSVLALYVREEALSRRMPPRVAHITVLEEAHRIMPEPGEHADDESGDPRGVAARLMTDMLAEVRSAGEVIVVSDQSPSQVARNVIRNTNLKIAHRILDSDDRAIVAGSIGMTEEEGQCISRLGPGEVLVSTTRLVEPQAAVIFDPATYTSDGTAPSRVTPGQMVWSQRSEARLRPCCDGLDQVAHHLSEQLSNDAEHVMAIWVAGLVTGAADPAETATGSRRALEQLVERRPGVMADCLAWIGLRRTITKHVALGLLPVEASGAVLQGSFGTWQDTSSDNREWIGVLRRSSERTGIRPFDGCELCAHPCHLRVVGVGNMGGSVVELEALVARTALSQRADALAIWLRTNRDRMVPLSGADLAKYILLCAATQFVHRRGLSVQSLIAAEESS